MQARLDLHGRVIVQPRGEYVHPLENQLAREAHARREFVHRGIGQLDELIDRRGAERYPVFRRYAMPPAVRDVVLELGRHGLLQLLQMLGAFIALRIHFAHCHKNHVFEVVRK